MILKKPGLKRHARYLFAGYLVLCAGFAAAAAEFKENPASVAPAAEQGAPPPARVQPSAAPVKVRPVPLMPPAPDAGRPGPAQARGVEKVAPGIYRLGEISIDKKLKEVSFPARVNMDKGLLEYLLVRNGGKTHESLLRTAVEPTDLQVALLLLGLEGTDRHLAAQGDPAKPGGEQVEIYITYPDAGGNPTSVGPETWMARKSGDTFADVEKLSWVFTGSMIYNNRFLAQVEGSIIAVYHDPVALLDNASSGGESDKIWFVNQKSVPPVGTPVMVTISRAR